MASIKGKSILIHLSSSSSSDDNGDDIDSASDSASLSSGDECESSDDDVYEVDEDGSEEDEESNEKFDNECHGAEDDDLSLSNRVIQFLQGRRDLQGLSLKACKAYLRRHGLRVSGNKDECASRVQEHWRIKDGKAEILYPRSSFVINCTGDVCKGDIVLFKQKVYGSARKGKLRGKRTVAGRVVKESYGAEKQQHTFTVEVLWSQGMRKLSPLFPLLIKGRNLYRLKTYSRGRTRGKEEKFLQKSIDEGQLHDAREKRGRMLCLLIKEGNLGRYLNLEGHFSRVILKEVTILVLGKGPPPRKPPFAIVSSVM
ncbi:zinc finger CCCH domain-containing protein 62 isoform X2 [Spinacia oleracea]|uniref:Zinc finger CCCH domain-containing protein 62 isoform X2 n=1 Tax=Spinacia oleracea TaxID=3562 RepID=A0ABM3RMI7_SPIOL|nr:zinc finger CCCH domain-containing protein 62-like isoform X2 [Spinacia oleracea]